MSVRRSRQNLARSREIQYQFYFGKVNGNSVVSSLISLAAISDFDFVPILFTSSLRKVLPLFYLDLPEVRGYYFLPIILRTTK